MSRKGPPSYNGLQDAVLGHLEEHKVPVTIYLVNGARLQGTVTKVDSYSLLLTREQGFSSSTISSIAGEPSSARIKGSTEHVIGRFGKWFRHSVSGCLTLGRFSKLKASLSSCGVFAVDSATRQTIFQTHA